MTNDFLTERISSLHEENYHLLQQQIEADKEIQERDYILNQLASENEALVS